MANGDIYKVTWTGGFLFWGRQKHLEKVGTGSKVVASDQEVDLTRASQPTVDGFTFHRTYDTYMTVTAATLDVQAIHKDDTLELQQGSKMIAFKALGATDGSSSSHDVTPCKVSTGQ